MGKRKTARKPQKRVKLTLDKTFMCIYCSHDGTVAVKLDQENKIGHLACRACGANFQTTIHALAEPVDIYSEWLDSAEDLNKNRKPEEEGGHDDEVAESGRDRNRGRERDLYSDDNDIEDDIIRTTSSGQYQSNELDDDDDVFGGDLDDD
ncbi:transcription elongation factor 1 [Phlyctochytrium arcticum]|nr:transcription elongation factor 1 [Phlyctochytrium arcticum]